MMSLNKKLSLIKGETVSYLYVCTGEHALCTGVGAGEQSLASCPRSHPSHFLRQGFSLGTEVH